MTWERIVLIALLTLLIISTIGLNTTPFDEDKWFRR